MAEGLILSMALTSHIGWDGKFNEVHPSISYVYNSYSIGVFRNSLNYNSVFVSKITKFTGFHVQYGLANNYENKVIPMVIIKKPLNEHVNALVMPSYNKTSSKPAMVIGLEVQY